MMILLKRYCLLLAGVLPLSANPAEIADPRSFPKAGADQTTPSRAKYFFWINNTNEGTTEAPTLANLAFFQWLHDEYGMVLDIYAFFNLHVFVGRGLWDRYLFDRDPSTSFYVSRSQRFVIRVTDDAPLRIDFGDVIRPDRIGLIIPDPFSSQDLVEGEGGNAKRDSNYTYYFAVTSQMVGRSIEVVVLGNGNSDDNLRPEVWQTAQSAPFGEIPLILDPP